MGDAGAEDAGVAVLVGLVRVDDGDVWVERRDEGDRLAGERIFDELGPGEFGFFTGSIKEVADTRVGDTITEDKRPTAKARVRPLISSSALPSTGPSPR